MRAIVVALTAITLAGCATPGHSDRQAGVHPSVWGSNAAANAEARNVQVIVARNAKEARCKGEVSERPGRDGTAPRDYKCKRFQG